MQVKHACLKTIALRDYLEVCKPKVVCMMLVTVWVGMVLAANTWPAISLTIATLVGVGACAASAAAVNHWVDRQIDAQMKRTQSRPIADGRLSGAQVLPFAAALSIVGLLILVLFVNATTAWLTFFTLIGYAVVYTAYLKRATPQNIVIGGLAGAAPPLLGWTAMTNTIAPEALLLVLIIFTWTPPHFWALAIYREAEYEQARVPMLPVIYGAAFTKKMIFLYSLLLLVVSELPFIVGMSGIMYALTALFAGLRFMRDAWRLRQTDEPKCAFQLFRHSITYLLLIFVVMMLEHIWCVYV